MFSTGIVCIVLASILANLRGRPWGRGFNAADVVAAVLLYSGLGLCVVSLLVELWRSLP